MPKPPPLPTEVLARVVRISGIDGRVLVFLAGGFGVLSALGADWLGAAVGGLAAGAGLIELRGRRRLQNSDITGVRWLVRSQLILLAVVLSYAVYQYFTYDPTQTLAKFEKLMADIQQSSGMEPFSMAQSLGMSPAEFQTMLKRWVHQTYFAVGFGTVLCQGGLAYYYHLKGAIIARHLRKS